MPPAISCPNCGKPVQPLSRFCEHCGVDLAVAAAMAEPGVIKPPEQATVPPVAPEALVPRIGDSLIEQGLLQPEQLRQALAYQKERQAAGNPILIGQALLELGIISRETLDQVVTQQILKLQIALSEANRTLQRRVEERTQELQKALSRLQELNQLKSNFIANISHELRTPLTHIKGYLDLLADGSLGPLTPQQEEACKVLLRAESRLESLIEDLIQFSLASRGELSLNLRTCNMNTLIRIVVDRSQPKARQKGIALSALLPDEEIWIQADEDKLGWVLMQLLDNAIKFTPSNGRVAIKATRQRDSLAVSVMDNGIGIPPERLEEIFEPFHQLDGSATRRYAGTGLGLAMVKRILEAHHSEIKVQSAVGKGSRFMFRLPLLKVTAGNEGTSSSA